MTEYTQGICHDGAAILRDGVPMTIEEILGGLRDRDRHLETIRNYVMMDRHVGRVYSEIHQAAGEYSEDGMDVVEVVRNMARQLAMPSGCHRSHPHENMSPECERAIASLCTCDDDTITCRLHPCRPVVAELAETTPSEHMQCLATKIADESSRALIESHCYVAIVGGDEWWDTDLELPTIEPADAEHVAEAIEYLDLRGLLQRHPEYKSLVRWGS